MKPVDGRIYELRKTFDPKIWDFFKLVCKICDGDAKQKSHLKMFCPKFNRDIAYKRRRGTSRKKNPLRKTKEQMMYELGTTYDPGIT